MIVVEAAIDEDIECINKTHSLYNFKLQLKTDFKKKTK